MSLPVTTSHRRGNRVSFLPELQGPRASTDAFGELVSDPVRMRAVAHQARVQTREFDGASRGHPQLVDREVGEATELDVDALLEVRRPVSYQGMRRYIGRMQAPHRGGSRGVWFDSHNEQAHYQWLLMTQPVTGMSTQPMRLVWYWEAGLRSHVPDAFIRLDGRPPLLVDITRRLKLNDPQALASFSITRDTAAAAGWDYLVYTEMDPQQVANLSAIWSCRVAPPALSEQWLTRAPGLVGLQVLMAARHLGQSGPDFAAVWHLVARGALTLDFSQPIGPDTVLTAGPRLRGGRR